MGVLRRPTLIMLGLGEAGQKILYEVEVHGRSLGVIDPGGNGDVEPVRLVGGGCRPRSRHPGLSRLMDELKPAGGFLVKVSSGPRGSGLEGLVEAIASHSPIVSKRYGFSMVRIDVDERTLVEVAKRTLEAGLPVPPGVSLASTDMEVEDPVLGERVVLQPGGGSGGRSAAVYSLVRMRDGPPVLDLLGIPVHFNDASLIARLPTSIPSYRSMLLVHGLVGTGSGAAIAVLDSLKEVAGDILPARVKIDLAVVPSAEEAHMGKLPPGKWVKVFNWDVSRLESLLEEGVLDALILVDLDFALIQYQRETRIAGKGLDQPFLQDVNSFIRRVLEGGPSLYDRRELSRHSGAAASGLYAEYEKVDSIIARVLEPLLCIHGPRGVRFGAGGSSIDEVEFKDMVRGFVAAPLVTSPEVFSKYLLVAREGVDKGVESSDEAALATLILPLLHGMLAPVSRGMVEAFIFIATRPALKTVGAELGYLPEASDIAALIRDILGGGVKVNVLVSGVEMSAPVLGYALLKPRKYMKNIVSMKGWE